VFVNCQAKENYCPGNVIKSRREAVQTVVEENDFLM